MNIRYFNKPKEKEMRKCPYKFFHYGILSKKKKLGVLALSFLTIYESYEQSYDK